MSAAPGLGHETKRENVLIIIPEASHKGVFVQGTRYELPRHSMILRSKRLY